MGSHLKIIHLPEAGVRGAQNVQFIDATPLLSRPHCFQAEPRISGAEHRQTVAHGVSRGFASNCETSPGRGDRFPAAPSHHPFPLRRRRCSLWMLHAPAPGCPTGMIPHARFAQDAKTPRQEADSIWPPLFASWRLCVSHSPALPQQTKNLPRRKKHKKPK
jgi:hypothetical protein